MHVITGGAYNGKAAWVRKRYLLSEAKNCLWITAYKGESIPSNIDNNYQTVVIEGIESLVLQWCEELSVDQAREQGRAMIKKWMDWEQGLDNRQIIIIGTDISKGIVPIESNMRKWRDVTGWFYQDVIKESTCAFVIWYGIATKLKG